MSKPQSTPMPPRATLLVLCCNLHVLSILLRLLPRIRNLHQGYAAVLLHVRQVAEHVSCDLSESEVRRRVDVALQVLTRIQGQLYGVCGAGGSGGVKRGSKREVLPVLTSDDLSMVLKQLHWVDVACLSLPAAWRKLQSDVDSYRARVRILLDKTS